MQTLVISSLNFADRFILSGETPIQIPMSITTSNQSTRQNSWYDPHSDLNSASSGSTLRSYRSVPDMYHHAYNGSVFYPNSGSPVVYGPAVSVYCTMVDLDYYNTTMTLQPHYSITTALLFYTALLLRLYYYDSTTTVLLLRLLYYGSTTTTLLIRLYYYGSTTTAPLLLLLLHESNIVYAVVVYTTLYKPKPATRFSSQVRIEFKNCQFMLYIYNLSNALKSENKPFIRDL